MIGVPAPAPCRSCPYRRDVPSGVWDETEYAKLPPYDRETGEQPPSVFMCHQQDGRVCAGWAGTHDMENNFAMRLVANQLSEDVYFGIVDYCSPVPLFGSGTEAAEHGLARVEKPPEEARRVIERLRRRDRQE